MKKQVLLIGLLTAATGHGDPTATRTEVLGGFTGPGAELHPGNVEPVRVRYYGTDLGWTYEHKGKLQILFGDTMETPQGRRAEQQPRLLDDVYGSIDLAEWPDPAQFGPGNIPRVLLGQEPGTDQLVWLDPGIPMEGFKTPLAGFSNGRDEFGLFYTHKPRGCREDADCGGGMSCDNTLGYAGQPFDEGAGMTVGCLEGSSPACLADTMTAPSGEPVAGSGLCSDPGSTIWAAEGFGRIAAVGVRHRIGRRDTDNPGRYVEIKEWLTNRFLNPALRTVQDFDPGRGPQGHDYTVASDTGNQRKVFLWGRPAFIGVGARNRPAGLYFAYADMPEGESWNWKLHYFAGLDDHGAPRFSPHEQDAAALDLDAGQPGVQPDEIHDVVDQMSVAWVAPLGKWVMFYGGGLTDVPYPPWTPTCGVLEFFTGPECVDVEMGDGAFRMRTADHPWGPWSKPQDIIAGGNPSKPGAGQYGPGGVLHHPACTDPGCALRTPARDVSPDDYGFFYSSIIIPQWTRPSGEGADLIWLASTWNPYRVILLRTHIEP